MTIELRPEVQRFAELMEQVLRENDHKGGWKGMTKDELLYRLGGETQELDWELAVTPDGFPGGPQKIAKEAADVANFAMFIADNFGGLMEMEV